MLREGRDRPRQRHIAGIDGLRGVAVLAVFVYHLDPSAIPGGFAGVDLFFVISGFVVAMATSGVATGSAGELLLTFYHRRVVRIVPAAMVFLLLTQALTVLYVPTPERRVLSDSTAAAATAGLSNIVLWLKSGDYFAPEAHLNPFTHTWSLGVEEQFYFMFPFLALLLWARGTDSARRLGIGLLSLLTVASLAAAAWLTSADADFAFYMLPARFWELGVGVLLFTMIGHAGAITRALQPTSAAAHALGVVGFGGLIWSFAVVTPDGFPFPLALGPVAAAVALIAVVSLAPDSWVARALSLPPLRYVGRISYSLYLYHWGVIVLMQWTSGLETVPEKAFAIAVSFALAHASYRFVEQPVRGSRGVAEASHRKVVATGLLTMLGTGVAIVALVLLRPTISQSVTRDADVWLGSIPVPGTRCNVLSESEPIADMGTRFDFTPEGCPASSTVGHLYLVGDSHARAYQRLTSRVAESLGIPSTIYASPGCSVLTGIDHTNARNILRCRLFLGRSLAATVHSADRGDVVILPGLRTDRYRSFSDSDFRPTRPARRYTDSELVDATALLTPLFDRGVRVVLEAPKPTYRIAPQRCADWFTRSNPHCLVPEVTRAEALARRAPVMAVYERVVRMEPRIEVWDPFQVLCPNAVCRAIPDGGPITVDGDHLTGYANDLLLPQVERLLQSGGN